MLQKAAEFEPLHSRDDKEVSDLISFYENPRRETFKAFNSDSGSNFYFSVRFPLLAGLWTLKKEKKKKKGNRLCRVGTRKLTRRDLDMDLLTLSTAWLATLMA